MLIFGIIDIMISELLIYLLMNKILQATSRGQITIPKVWRDKFDTNYYVVEIKDEEIIMKPMLENKTFKDGVESSWEEYKNGDFIDGDQLMKKYGI